MQEENKKKNSVNVTVDVDSSGIDAAIKKGRELSEDLSSIASNGAYHKSGTYKGRAFKGDAELDAIEESVCLRLRTEGLPIWQAKEVLKKASHLIDWEVLK